MTLLTGTTSICCSCSYRACLTVTGTAACCTRVSHMCPIRICSSVAPANQSLDYMSFVATQLQGDLFDLDQIMSPSSAKAKGSRRQPNSHCSALIRVLPGFSELYSSHATWAGFETMTRVWKVSVTEQRLCVTAFSNQLFRSCMTSLGLLVDRAVTWYRHAS
jgi:hypothetical protein